jgi:hypothetical protein
MSNVEIDRELTLLRRIFDPAIDNEKLLRRTRARTLIISEPFTCIVPTCDV